MTIDDLASADLCYAPAYSEALDNLITAANVVRNKLEGHMDGVTPEALWEKLKRGPDFVLLDVRTPSEHERVRLPRSVLIPLGSLKERARELPKNKEIITYCDISLRAYEAALILRAAGMETVRVLEGGLAMWPYETVE
jgi:rhodanese-related sulfurtransferase